jgi:hypothetical protein
MAGPMFDFLLFRGFRFRFLVEEPLVEEPLVEEPLPDDAPSAFSRESRSSRSRRLLLS